MQSSSYTYSANSSHFYISLSTIYKKTLYEIEVYNNLYPELKRNYNFILFPAGEIVDNHSINPTKIDFKNDVIYYDNFNFKNIDKVAEYTVFSDKNIPGVEGTKNGNINLFISIPVHGEKNIDGYYKLGEYNLSNNKLINNYYYDFINKEISISNGFKVNGLNFPVESFNLKVIFSDLGVSKSNFEVVKTYKNNQKFFGECEVSSFCFI